MVKYETSKFAPAAGRPSEAGPLGTAAVAAALQW